MDCFVEKINLGKMDISLNLWVRVVSRSDKGILHTKHVRSHRVLLFAARLFQSLGTKCKAKVLICSAGAQRSGVRGRMSQSCVLTSRTPNQKPCGCNKNDV